MYFFPNLEPVFCSMSVLLLLDWYRFPRRQVKWSGSPISWRIFHSLLWSTQRLWHSQWSQNRCFFFFFSFWNSLAFYMIQRMLAICSLFPLPFLHPAWTSGNSWFTYCWSLAWKILSITLLACEMRAIVWWFEHSLALPFFGIDWTFSSPVATAEFSKFAGILSEALSQHHLLGIEIAQLEYHHLH